LLTFFVTVLIAMSFPGCKSHNARGSSPLGAAVPILLFNGDGTSPNDVLAIESILFNAHLDYSTANSAQLNAMSETQLRQYRLLIVPGGNFIDMGKSLTTATSLNIHNAVKEGLNYFGICAGGFLAGQSAYYNSFKLAPGKQFGFYSAANKNIQKAAVPIITPGGNVLEQYWENGPQFQGWGDVIGKYPDGTPAITEGTCGHGWVILAGIHAEAPEEWRNGMIFRTSADTDNAYALKIINAALDRISLPHY